MNFKHLAIDILIVLITLVIISFTVHVVDRESIDYEDVYKRKDKNK